MEFWGFALLHADGGSHRLVLADALDLVQAADGGGLDGWFFPEHHGDASHSLSSAPHILIGAASQRTQRLRLGTMVSVLPLWHPQRLAEEVRTLDALSGGRLEVGVGAGTVQERRAWGIDDEDAKQVLESAFERFLTCLVSQPQGEVPVVPEPTQRPHPPLWLAGVHDETVAKAARWGVSCDMALSSLDALPSRVARYRATWAEHHPGTPAGRFGVLVDVVVGDDRAEARRVGEAFHRRRVARLTRAFPNPNPDRGALDDRFRMPSYGRLIEDGLVVCGTVDDCVEQLGRIRDAEVDAVTAWIPLGEVDLGFVRRSLQLLGDEVAPALA